MVACLKSESCRTMTGVVGAALALQAAKIMQENPGLSESDAFSLAIVDYGASVLTGKPANPLPPAAPTITPADARKIYGTPPLNDPEQLRAWLGQALQGYPADEAEKWAQDLIRTLPAAEQKKYSELITQQVHHICTDKNCISPNSGGPWTPEFKKMFDKAGLSLQDDLNQIWVAGHKGPHPQEYHREVFDRLEQVTEGKTGNAYTQAFQNELAKIGKEIQTPGTKLNNLVTKK